MFALVAALVGRSPTFAFWRKVAYTWIDSYCHTCGLLSHIATYGYQMGTNPGIGRPREGRATPNYSGTATSYMCSIMIEGLAEASPAERSLDHYRRPSGMEFIVAI